MNPTQPDLEIRFEGEALNSASLTAAHIVALTKTMSLVHIGIKQVCQGAEPVTEFESSKIGINLVSLRPEPEAMTLGFEVVDSESSTKNHSKGIDILKTAIAGLSLLKSSLSKETLPPAYDNRVLDAWLKMKKIFKDGINRIQFTLYSTHDGIVTKGSLTNDDLRCIKRYNKALNRNKTEVTVEGQLLMVDLVDWRARLTIYPRGGKCIQCTFDPDLRFLVASKLTAQIRIKGVATRFYNTGEVRKMKAKAIEPLAQHSLWDPSSLKEQRKERNVKAIEDLSTLRKKWEGDLDNDFEELIYKLRRGTLNG